MATVLVQPPLLLSKDFIDYPYWAVMAAAQAGAVLRSRDIEPELIDGLSGAGADFTSGTEQEAWLGVSRRRFLEQLDGLEGSVVIINTPPFLLAPPGRRWLGEVMAHLQGVRPALVVLAEMYMGGMHHLDLDPASWLPDLAGDPLLLRFECEPLLERLANELQLGRLPSGEIWEGREPFPLDDLPAPAWDLLDMEAHFAFITRALGAQWRPGPIPPTPGRTLPLVSARGCPFGCTFCTSNPGLADARTVRTVPLPRVEAWVDRWVEDHGLERLVLLDEVANLDAARFHGLLKLAEERGLALELPNGLRADRLTRDHVRRLSRLSSSITISLESASPRVQRELLGKDLDPCTVERVAKWCHEVAPSAGLLQVHCLIGMPGEQRHEILATLELAARLHEMYGARVLLQNATPLPGTELHRICQEQGLLVGDPVNPWSAFQQLGMIRTAEFDPELLNQARWALERRTAPPPRPKVIVNLTYRCNNHCSFCAVGDRPRHDADPAQVIQQLRRHREEGYELLDMDGGEPTLHEDLFKIIRAARAMGYGKIALISNGRRLGYAAYTRELLRAGVDEVLVSLHCAEEKLNAHLTGVTGAWEQTVAGIRQLLKTMPDPNQVAVNTTLAAQNLGSLDRLAGLLNDLGIKRWNLQLVTPFGRAHAGLVPREEDLLRHLGALLDQPPPGLRIQLVNCPPCLAPGHEQAAAADQGKAWRNMVFVGAEGENLQLFLSGKRRRTPRCEGCMYALVCPGEYQFRSE